MAQLSQPNSASARKPLQCMTPTELVAWLVEHQGNLENFVSYVQEYLLRRSRRGRHTGTDDRYALFLAQAVDLIIGLGELREIAEQKAQEELSHADMEAR